MIKYCYKYKFLEKILKSSNIILLKLSLIYVLMKFKIKIMKKNRKRFFYKYLI